MRLAGLVAPLILILPGTLPFPGIPALIPHPPITILSDEGFQQPGSGVIGGHGTPESPYIISGWLLAGATFFQPLIHIENTSAHVVIRQNHLRTTLGFGILLRHAANVSILSNDIDTGRTSEVIAIESRGVAISQNVLLGQGIFFLRSEDIRISGNTVRCPSGTAVSAFELTEVRNLSFETNDVSCQGGPAFWLRFSDGASISGNRFHESFGSLVQSEFTSNLRFHFNTITDYRASAMFLSEMENVSLVGNTIQNGGTGLSLHVDGPVEFRDNHMSRIRPPSFLLHAKSKADLSFSNNTIEGLAIETRKDMRDAIVDGAGLAPAMFLLQNLENVTVRNWNIGLKNWHSIVLLNGTGVSIENNTVAGGIHVHWGSDNLIQRNAVNISRGSAIWAESTHTQILNNTVMSNTRGIDVGRWMASWPAAPDHAYVAGNFVDAPGCPLCLVDTNTVLAEMNTFRGSGPLLRLARNTTLHNNNIVWGYLTMGEQPDMVDARFNWWGSPDKPGFEHPRVVLEPWLTAPYAP